VAFRFQTHYVNILIFCFIFIVLQKLQIEAAGGNDVITDFLTKRNLIGCSWKSKWFHFSPSNELA